MHTCMVVALVVAGVVHAAAADERGDTPERLLRSAIQHSRARNVILMIGDGLGDSEITMARNYSVGAAGRLHLDTLPLTGACTTYAVDEHEPHRPVYVVDSAASATALVTGHKTSNRRVSTAPGTGAPLTTILELAQRRGLRTGSVTTSELTDATPAALAAHVAHRACQGPADMQLCPGDPKGAAGRGSIAEQTVDRHIDVLLGGGRDRFEQTIDAGPHAGMTVTQSALAQGYAVIATAAELEAAGPDRKLLGVFAPGNLSLEWTGDPAAAYPGTGPQRCVEGQRPDTEPSLAAMTRMAIALLDRGSTGFFLQVEGASIDKRNHAADPCGQIGETIAFDAAVGVALEFARRRGDTLVIVTGDHAHTSQIIPPPLGEEYSPGVFSTLITAEGVPMTVAYAGNRPGRSQPHTGTQIRVAAEGPRAARVVGVIDQTDVFHIMAGALGAGDEPVRRGPIEWLRRLFGGA